MPPFFVPTPGDLTAQESPPREFAIQGKKNANVRGSALGAGGIDWCISNGNRTEWNPLRSVIIRVTHNLFHQEYDYRPNWTTRSSVTN